jgi:thiol-disulfide isomerase/thioredoxin
MVKRIASLVVCLIVCPATRAASITISFKPEAGQLADYTEVHVKVRAIPYNDQTTVHSYSTHDKEFRKTFSGLKPGRYDVTLYTTATEPRGFVDPVPGAFVTRKLIKLDDPDSEQFVEFQYARLNLNNLHGNGFLRGRVLKLLDQPVADLPLVAAAELQDMAVKVAQTRTAADGSFQFTGLNPDLRVYVNDGSGIHRGFFQVGKEATIYLEPVVGDLVPDVELIALEDGRRRNLSEFRGKVVLLEFWATWCEPCQDSMARLQRFRAAHPDRANELEVITVSMDATAEEAFNHIRERGWTRTYNTWAGAGTFNSPIARAFSIDLIPWPAVIGADGRVPENDKVNEIFKALQETPSTDTPAEP